MRITPNGRGLGWRRQKPDHKDALFLHQTPLAVARALPKHKDLRPQDLPIHDQGELGSCVGHGTVAVVEFARKKHRQSHGEQTAANTPSRLMAYYLARELEDDVPYDAGAEVRDGLKGAAKTGLCFEDLWPYDVRKFTQRPPPACYSAAQKDRALIYRPVAQTAQALRGCLAHGYPIVFGFTCYPGLDSNEVADTGMLPMPGPHESPIGGHCVVLMGYDDEGGRSPARHFIVRNSWGPDWGDEGYFYMPYEYIQRADLSSDFWMCETVG
jgi:C1A family cysteine protease